jgi:hypothetical protein
MSFLHPFVTFDEVRLIHMTSLALSCGLNEILAACPAYESKFGFDWADCFCKLR